MTVALASVSDCGSGAASALRDHFSFAAHPAALRVVG
jgi:hypothetical protein